ncbi:MAG: DUF930 domain-containing protein [Allorhizobium sp.]
MRSKPSQPGCRRQSASLAAAALLHVLVLSLLWLLPEVRPLPMASQESVSVSVITPQQFEAAVSPPQPAPAAPVVPIPTPAVLEPAIPLPDRPQPIEGPASERPPLPAATAPKPAEQETRSPPPADPNSAMVVAKSFYAQKILADPRSRQAREGLDQLERSERMTQLCNLEAMEQLHRWRSWLDPDFLIAYATGDTKISDTDVIADGAAFRSRKHWFSVRYDCKVANDRQSVTALTFSLGPEIPTEQWATLGLTSDDGPDD